MTIKFTAQNFGCLKNFEIDLQPLHALIGPNDSGKSTVLRGLAVLTAFRHGAPWTLPVANQWRAHYATTQQAQLSLEGPALVPRFLAIDPNGAVQWGESPGKPGAHDLANPIVIKLVPERLRQPSSLIPEKDPITFDGVAGGTLAGVYDALNNRNPDAGQRIRDQVRGLFPSIDRLQFTNTTTSQKSLRVLLRTGETVEADALSEGLLYYLGFAALPYLDVSGPILVEEPENGLHPARIREVMNVLKEVSKTSQVVIATHSPLVINELEPDQVSIITRDPETGSKATLMTKTKNFRERAGVYALGELWLSYADGEMEKDLVGDDA